MIKFLNDLRKSDTASFLIFENESINNRDWNSVTFDTCTLTASNISEVSLKNSDVVGTTIEISSLTDVDFSHSDICSTICKNTKFENVKFDVSTIKDCEFSSCEFENCSFEHVAMTYSKFEKCIFRNIKINQSSSYLNNFLNCEFVSCQFLGNFFYSLFVDCALNREFLSGKLLAHNIFIPAVKHELSEEVSLHQELIEKKMFINIEILKLNQSLIDPDRFIFESLIAIHKLISNSIVVRIEQIDFVRNFAETYFLKNMIRTITIVQAITIIDKIFEDTYSNENALRKSTDKLNQIKNTFFLEYINRINTMPALTIDFAHTQPTLYKFIFEEEPEVEISKIINKTLQKMGIEAVKATRISSEKGSFIEVVEFIKNAEPLIQIILSLTTGAVIPIVVENFKKKKDKDKPSTNNNTNYNGANFIVINNPSFNLINISSNQDCYSAAAQVLLENDVTVNTNFKGYSRANVRSVEIVVNDDKDS